MSKEDFDHETQQEELARAESQVFEVCISAIDRCHKAMFLPAGVDIDRLMKIVIVSTRAWNTILGQFTSVGNPDKMDSLNDDEDEDDPETWQK